MKMLELRGDDFANVDFESVEQQVVEESTMGDIEEDDFGETVNGVQVKSMRVVQMDLSHMTSLDDESSESSEDDYEEQDLRDPILRVGGVKIYPWSEKDFLEGKEDFIDMIEDFFYPDYLYAEPNQRKTVGDLLDLASADLPILKDHEFMEQAKNYLLDVDKNFEAVQINDVYLNFAEEKFCDPANGAERKKKVQ